MATTVVYTEVKLEDLREEDEPFFYELIEELVRDNKEKS